MGTITTEDVKTLREATGISVMQCKKALEEAEGDFEKARQILSKKSREAAAKKQERELGSGVIRAYIHQQGSVGAMVELSCETDFVANNDEFKALAYDIAMHIAAMSPEYKSADTVDEDTRAKTKELFEKEVAELDKPDEVKKKILEGKIDTYFKERSLLDQVFIKDSNKTIRDLLTEAVQKFGENTDVTRFVRYAVSG